MNKLQDVYAFRDDLANIKRKLIYKHIKEICTKNHGWLDFFELIITASVVGGVVHIMQPEWPMLVLFGIFGAMWFAAARAAWSWRINVHRLLYGWCKGTLDPIVQMLDSMLCDRNLDSYERHIYALHQYQEKINDMLEAQENNKVAIAQANLNVITDESLQNLADTIYRRYQLLQGAKRDIDFGVDQVLEKLKFWGQLKNMINELKVDDSNFESNKIMVEQYYKVNIDKLSQTSYNQRDRLNTKYRSLYLGD